MSAPDDHTLIGLLGPVEIGALSPDEGRDDAAATPPSMRPVPGVRAKRLLAALALADGRTLSAERLIDDVWGADPPRSPGAALHTQISRLRQTLGHGSVEASGNGYRLVGCRTDLEIVEKLLSRGTEADLRAAQQWWRGTPGDDLGDDRPGGLVSKLRARTARLGEQIERGRLPIALAAGDFATARQIAEKYCRADPLDEVAHLDLMRTLAGEGRIADALAVYTRLRRRLSTDLGVDPGRQVSDFYLRLLDESDSADRPDAAAPPPGHDATGAARRRARTTGLLVETTELVGRDDDIAAIRGLLDRQRLVTIQGPGGVGKTRVANRVGAELAGDGATVFYVPLAPIRNDDDVVPAIAGALGVGDTDIGGSGRPRLAVGDLEDRLVDALRGRRAVVILDNCEQVIGRCARVVADLLAADPQVCVVVTSRAPLMLGAEQIYLLPPLDIAAAGPAVELFGARARAVRPDVRLPADAVADLCRHLDGLPLAIELAAARTRSMTVDEIGALLAERFSLLRAADPTAPDRHRTLYAVIEWSWELLDPGAQDALRRLSRFPAGFTTDAASVVLGENGIALLDDLDALVNQSLLTVAESDGQMRYRMLETVREFADSKLSDAGSAGIDREMARWARGFCTDLQAAYERHVPDSVLLESLAREVENLLWVLRRAHASQYSPRLRRYDELPEVDAEMVDTIVGVYPMLSALWSVRGLHVEVLTWGERVLRVLPAPPRAPDDAERHRWQAAVLWGTSHMMMRKVGRAVGVARLALRRLHRPDETYADTMELLSAMVLSRTALGAVRHVVRATRSPHDDVARAGTGLRMGLRENLGHLDGALADGLRLHEMTRDRTDQWFIAMNEMTLGGILGQQGQWARALPHYGAAVAALDQLGADEDELQARCYRSASLTALGRTVEAATELDIVCDGWTPSQPDPQGNPEIIGLTMVALADLELARGARDVAEELYFRAGVLLIREHPLGAQDPGLVMLLSVATVGLSLVGAEARAREFVPLLADGVRQTFSDWGWRDLPQVGTAALALGHVWCTEPDTHRDGVRFLALARKLYARRDYRTLDEGLRRSEEVSGLDSADWERALHRVVEMPQRQATDELQAVLASRTIV